MSEFEEKLINEIYKYPCIYNKKDIRYRNKLQREKAWAAVAAVCQSSTHHYQGRWKTLRDRFVKEVNKNNHPSGSGAPNAVSSWRFMTAMEFMRIHVAPRPTISNIHVSEEADAYYELDEMQSQQFEAVLPEPATASNEPLQSSSSVSARRKAIEADHESFNDLCGTVNNIIKEKLDNTSRKEAFYKFLDTILTKVNENEQDTIKLQLITSCNCMVNEILKKN